MNHKNNAEVVTTVLELLNAGEVTKAVGYIHEDFVCREAASLPYAGEYRGKEGFTRLLGLLSTTWNDFGFKIHKVFADGEDVTVVETIWGRVAGKRWEMPVIEMWKIRDGKVLEAIPYYHDAGLLGRLHKAQLDAA
jgi:uncharacterized protein